MNEQYTAQQQKLENAITARLTEEAAMLLHDLWSERSSCVDDDLLKVTLKCIDECLTEFHILEFHDRWGAEILKSKEATNYLDSLSKYKTIRFSDITRNVILGKDGYLFLSGGRHSVLDYITGRKEPSSVSYENFSQNIKNRLKDCSSKNILYKHIIYPDKHAVHSEKFPLDRYVCLGDEYLERSPELSNCLMYPKLSLRKAKQPFHKKDTHMADEGYCLLTAELMVELGLTKSVCYKIFEELIRDLTGSSRYSGDLGSKLDPEDFDVKVDIAPSWSYAHYKNNLGISNDGLAELYFNKTAITNWRIVVFGDSFSRLHSLFLSKIFRDVAFFRTRYYHQDIIDMSKPDVVLTGNAERYLSVVDRDENAPNFFLYPLLKGIGHAPDQAYAMAMNAFLSYGKPAYTNFKNTLN
nr:hypothetical protein [uncultured Pseudomonas sp.]